MKMLSIRFYLSVSLFFISNLGLAQTHHLVKGEVPNIIGQWRFVGHIYRGQIIPPLNDKLVLTFQFFVDGTDILKWYRIGEDGFCERTAKYRYDGHNLIQQVISVNPNNSMECSKDSDMRLGTITESPFYKREFQMYLDLPLGDETLTYIWEPVQNTNNYFNILKIPLF